MSRASHTFADPLHRGITLLRSPSRYHWQSISGDVMLLTRVGSDFSGWLNETLRVSCDAGGSICEMRVRRLDYANSGEGNQLPAGGPSGAFGGNT